MGGLELGEDDLHQELLHLDNRHESPSFQETSSSIIKPHPHLLLVHRLLQQDVRHGANVTPIPAPVMGKHSSYNYRARNDGDPVVKVVS